MTYEIADWMERANKDLGKCCIGVTCRACLRPIAPAGSYVSTGNCECDESEREDIQETARILGLGQLPFRIISAPDIGKSVRL